MLRGAALIAALLAVSACGIDPVTPEETRVDYAGFVNTADQAAIYANAQCAKTNRLAVFKVEDVVDGRKGATFQCLPVQKCFPAEAGVPGQPVPVAAVPPATHAAPAAAVPVAAAQPGYTVPATAAARLPGPIVAMAPVSSARDRRAAARAAGRSIDAGTEEGYVPFAARPVAAGPQPQQVPSYEVIGVPPGPNPVTVDQAGPQPAGSYATSAPSTWQRAVTCKPYDTLPLAMGRDANLF